MTISVRAHGYSQRNGSYVFVALMQGDPPSEYELLRVPETIVEDVDGGWTRPPGGSDDIA